MAARVTQGASKALLGRGRLLFLLLEVDSDNHGGSIVRVVLTMLSPTVAHIVRLPEVPSTASSPVAALVVVVMVSLLLSLHAHVRHNHFGAVAHSHCVPAEFATSGAKGGTS